MIHFEIPKNQSSIIKVIGVGGGGSNAVNYMYNLGIEGTDFIVCNTDSQALAMSPVPNKIQLGPHLTSGLGAGANPEIGKKACEESLEDIAKLLKVNTRMAFITAGMGGGTGTGGAPVVAKICRELGILTVGIVTLPFPYEGRKRMKQAQEGIDRMREHVDTILIISNDKLRMQFGNLPFTKAFAKADDILATAAKCITDVINTTGQLNVDFADVCTVMRNGGVAILGHAEVAGENRAQLAVEEALNSPLLNDNEIKGAKWILLNITSAEGDFEHSMDEAEIIQAYVQQQAGDYCDVILGMGHDPNLENRLAVTIIATGFNHNTIQDNLPEKNTNQIVLELDVKKSTPEEHAIHFSKEPHTVVMNNRTTEETKANVEPSQPSLIIENANSETQYLFQVEDRPWTKPLQDKSQETNEESKEALKSPSAVDMFREMKGTEDVKEESPIKMTERVLSPYEQEEQQRFEEQKRALEERAERLRRMSFNINGQENTDDVENVPAYLRRQVTIQEKPHERNELSGYSIGQNAQNEQSKIQTINTFLDGKKPD